MSNIALVHVEGPTLEERYLAPNGAVARREVERRAPNGNLFAGVWVLRTAEGAYIDHDRNRHDLFERNGFSTTCFLSVEQYLEQAFSPC